MHRASSRTDRIQTRRRALATALGVVLLGVGVLRLVVHKPRATAIALLSIGALLIVLRVVRGRAAAALVAPIDRLLGVLGAAVGTAALTVFYVVIFVPYALLLRAIGAVEGPDEPFPPQGSGWLPIEDAGPDRTRKAMRGLLRRMVVDFSSAAKLVGFFSRRPSALLVPVVVIILLFAAGVVLGEVTGLGPLIYSLF
jgi:hypothetical protein